ncbi:MAG: PorV/PorQ family protein [Candidatus Glassbacteria bacterium]|nr:PorV/PorQ family protein [Candidatus Glassbacteria bacterium]
MKRKLIFLAVMTALLSASSSVLFAQKGIKDYFKDQNGARAIGMGYAFTGVAEGLSTVLWNPAGLVSVTRPEVYFSRYQGFTYTTNDAVTGLETEDQISFNFFNFGMPIKEVGVLAVSMNLWDLGSSVFTNIGSEPTGFDDQSLWMFYGSYATRLSKKVDIGVTMKYIREKLSSEAGGIGTSAALDVGVLYRPIDDVPLQIGAAIMDIGTDMQFKNEYQADRLPRRVRIGAGYNILKHLLEQERFNLLLAVDYERFLVGSPQSDGIFIGTEFGIEPFEAMLLSMRSGYLSEEGELSGALIGFGINYKGYSFDLARELGVNPLSDRTFFSVSAHF